jgi:hypothetical protein
VLTLSFDPGTANFGYCVSDFKKRKYAILENGLIKPTVRDINNDVSGDLKRYAKTIRKLCDRFPTIELFIAERFMTRGLSGPLIESVAIMFGRGIPIVQTRTSVTDIKLVTAAVWKNEVNKTIDLKELYKIISVTPHQADSFLMGAYNYYVRHLQDKELFSEILTNYQFFIDQLELTSLEPLRNRRGKVSSSKHRNRK